MPGAASVPIFANYLPIENLAASVGRGTRRIWAWHATTREAERAELADRLAESVLDLEGRLGPRPPERLVHGDFWDDNVLFVGAEVVLVTNFDFLGRRPRLDDLALTLGTREPRIRQKFSLGIPAAARDAATGPSIVVLTGPAFEGAPSGAFGCGVVRLFESQSDETLEQGTDVRLFTGEPAASDPHSLPTWWYVSTRFCYLIRMELNDVATRVRSV